MISSKLQALLSSKKDKSQWLRPGIKLDKPLKKKLMDNGISVKMYTLILYQNRTPDLITLTVLCDIIGINPSDLIS